GQGEQQTDTPLHQVVGDGIHFAAGMAAGAVSAKAALAHHIEQRLCDDAAGRIPGAQEQDVVDASGHEQQALATTFTAALAGVQHEVTAAASVAPQEPGAAVFSTSCALWDGFSSAQTAHYH